MSQATVVEKWRVFIAVELPPEIRARLRAHAGRLREMVPEAKASWSRPENIHLTLKFIGDTSIDRLTGLCEAAARTVAPLQPFTIAVAETGVFPSRSVPKVLWIGLKDSEGRLSELHSRLEEECAQAGFAKEARPFHPHLTLARLRQPQHARALASTHMQMPFELAEFYVSEVLVIRSELSSAGSRYTTISCHQLGYS